MHEIEITICYDELVALGVFSSPGVFPFVSPGIYPYEASDD